MICKTWTTEILDFLPSQDQGEQAVIPIFSFSSHLGSMLIWLNKQWNSIKKIHAGFKISGEISFAKVSTKIENYNI